MNMDRMIQQITSRRVNRVLLSDSEDDLPPLKKSKSLPTLLHDIPPFRLEPSAIPPPVSSSLPPMVDLNCSSDSCDSQDSDDSQPLNNSIRRERLIQRKVGQVPGMKTLIVCNLPRDISIQELRDIFETYGIIRDIYIPKNMEKTSPYFGTVKGFALIKFLKPESALQAFRRLYKKLTIRNRFVKLQFAKEDR
jgi:hypothetical protein